MESQAHPPWSRVSVLSGRRLLGNTVISPEAEDIPLPGLVLPG